MSSKSGRHFHHLAEIAREKGDFLQALKYTDEAMLSYQKDNDLFGLAEVQSSRQSTFKHLYRSTGDEIFLILEKYSAESAVAIAKKSKNKEALGIPFHNLGKYYDEVKDYKNASKYFALAVKNLESFTNNPHSRISVIADIKGHLYASQYHCGDKSALQRAEDALEELKKCKEDSYNKTVWITGAHLRIAEMLQSDDPQKSKKHVIEAEKIINKDSRLILRKEQLTRYTKSRH